jgi:ribosomal protein L29
MRPWKLPLLVAGLALLAGAGLLAFRQEAQDAAPQAQPSTAGTPARTGAPGFSVTAAAGAPGTPARDAEWAQLAAAVRERYASRLSTPHGQLRVLEKLIRHFRERGGPDWEAQLRAFLATSLPEHATALTAQLGRWLTYERWMEENEGQLRQLPPEERRANVWEERRRLFGAQADDIWAGELRHEAELKALAQVDARPNATVSERVADYRAQLERIHGEQAPRYLEQHRQEVLDRFLELGSVQQELSALAPAARSARLREVREGLGLDAPALERWEELDRTRDARWAAGSRYMEARAELARRYSGAELESRLGELRARTFGAEAQTVAEEEETGFFRFGRPRVHGRN